MKLTANDPITLKRMQNTREMVAEINEWMAAVLAAHENKGKKK